MKRPFLIVFCPWCDSPWMNRGQVTIRYYGLYANAHRGKVKKAIQAPVSLGMMEELGRPIPSKGLAQMIRKVYEWICPPFFLPL